MNHRTTLLAAGMLGATGVALGALGAHALRDFLAERGMTVAWETAARYHIIHSVALFAAAAWLRSSTGAVRRRLGWAAACWVAGTVLFSGSLYATAAGGPHWLWPGAPLGGSVLIAGWLCVVAAALAKED